MAKRDNSQEHGLYINPMTDYGFKRIFGDEGITKAFLNDLLKPNPKIQAVTFLNKEEQAENDDNKGVVYDIRCELEDGKEIIIEMQNREQVYFRDRIVYYLSRSITPQGFKGSIENPEKKNKKGEPMKEPWDFQLHPVYGIFFLNFSIEGLKPCMVRTVRLKVEETGEVFNDKLRAYTIELPQIKDKRPEDCNSDIEFWVYNLYNMESMTSQLQFMDRQPAFARMSELANYASLSYEQQESYMRSLDNYRTAMAAQKYDFNKGLEKGLVEGRAEGLAEGRAEATLENARSMIAAGIDRSIVIKALSLTEEQIIRL